MIGQIRQIALYQIGGKPLVIYFGLVTFASFAFTAYIGYTNYKGKKRIPFKYHPMMVIVSFIIAFIHALLAFSIFYSI
jgi:hypothetical protein